MLVAAFHTCCAHKFGDIVFGHIGCSATLTKRSDRI